MGMIETVYIPIEFVCWRVGEGRLPLRQKRNDNPIIDKDNDYDKFNQRRIFKKGGELFGQPIRMEVPG